MGSGTIEIFNVAAKPGEKAKGWQRIADTPLHDVSIPLGIVNGAKPGPTVCITGGLHGSEYPGVTAVGETYRDLRPAETSGAVVVVPVVNTLAYERRVGFVVPVDGLNPNRVAPGDPGGTMAEILVHTLINEVIGRCEYHIDCQGGDLGEVLNPHAIFTRTGNAHVDSYSEAMAGIYDTPFIVPTGEGSLLPFPKGTVHEEIARRGIPSIVGEVGSDGSLEREEADRHVRGIQNVLRFLGVLPGEPQITVKQFYARTKFFIHARRGGLLHLQVKLDDM